MRCFGGLPIEAYAVVIRGAGTLLIMAALTSWPTPAPTIPPSPATDEYFGHTVVDPYRNLEQLNDPAVRKYIHAETAYTQAVLAKLEPGRDAVRDDVSRFDDAGTTISDFAVAGGRVFYLERPAKANGARLMVAYANGNATPRLLLDPRELVGREGSNVHLSLTDVAPSPDGKFVAVGVMPNGSIIETNTRIVRVADRKLMPDDVLRTWWGVSAWSRDDKFVFYNQLRTLRNGESVQGRELDSVVYRHIVGTKSLDAPVFGAGVESKVSFQPIDIPFVILSPTSRYAFGVVLHGTKLGETIYVAPLESALGDAPIPWRKVVSPSDQVTNFDIEGSTLYLLSFKDAPRYKIVALDVGASQTASSAKTVVAQSEAVLQQVAVARDGVYVRGILGGLANLRKLRFRDNHSLGHAADVALPSDAAVSEFAADPNAPGAILGLVSWTKPLRAYELDASGRFADLGIRRSAAIGTSEYASVEATSVSADGTQVPLSIITRRGIKLDGSHPTYIEVFGAFGEDIDPYFLGPRLAWLDEGGVWVVAHVRGGGEYGEFWHRAGAGAEKEHSIEDAIGAARYLIAHDYTLPEHLAIGGASAGGIVLGGAITARPDLFAAALDISGVTNPLRLEAADPNGPVNAHEYGSITTDAGFESLVAMDPYHHITNGRSYPAVLAVTGMNDPLVAPWQSVKFVARLQAASVSRRPVLLLAEYGAGHGLRTATHDRVVDLVTDELSFLLWQCGSPLFGGVMQNVF